MQQFDHVVPTETFNKGMQQFDRVVPTEVFNKVEVCSSLINTSTLLNVSVGTT